MTGIELRFMALPVDDFALLATEARNEEQAFVARLDDDWRNGINQFSCPGEHFLGAYVVGQLAGRWWAQR